jgi:hypothetical protein
MPLNDEQIRPYLINFLKSASVKPQKVIEELPVSYGNAVADVVAVYKTLHCFEIKGETDTVQRIKHQGQFYNTSFLKITLVTTENHLDYAVNSAPSYWGILLAKAENGKTIFRYIRKAGLNPNFSKEEALHTLWKDELLKISQTKQIAVKEKMNKRLLSQILSEKLSTNFIAYSISNTIKNRNHNWKSLYI